MANREFIALAICVAVLQGCAHAFTPEIYVELANATADGSGGRVVVSKFEEVDGQYQLVSGTVCADDSWDDKAASAVCKQLSLAFGGSPDNGWDGGWAAEPGEFGPGGSDINPSPSGSSSSSGSSGSSSDDGSGSGDGLGGVLARRRLLLRGQPARVATDAHLSRRLTQDLVTTDSRSSSSGDDSSGQPLPPTPILMSNVKCKGGEWLLGACSYEWRPTVSASGCTHAKDAGVRCYRHSPPPPSQYGPMYHAPVHLASSFPYHIEDQLGRLEVAHGVRGWVSACANGMSDVEARVACRQMGFAGGRLMTDPFAMFFQDTSYRPLLFKQIKCNGTEAYLSDCEFQYTSLSVQPGGDGRYTPEPGAPPLCVSGSGSGSGEGGASGSDSSGGWGGQLARRMRRLLASKGLLATGAAGEEAGEQETEAGKEASADDWELALLEELLDQYLARKQAALDSAASLDVTRPKVAVVKGQQLVRTAASAEADGDGEGQAEVEWDRMVSALSASVEAVSAGTGASLPVDTQAVLLCVPAPTPAGTPPPSNP